MAYSELSQLTVRLTTEFPWLATAKYFEKVDSTQKRIMQFLAKDGGSASLVVAETQSQGVGRQNRSWSSAAGGIWFTVALPAGKITVAAAAPFSLVVGLTVAESLKEIYNLDCQVKWPNDILHEGKKVGGILMSTATKFRRLWLLAGVGINVNNELPDDLADIATSIQQIRGQSQGRTRLIESVLGTIWTHWSEFDRTGFGPFQKSFQDRMSGIGKESTIALGKDTLRGTLVGIDAQGGLLVESASGKKTITAGEVLGT